MPADTIRADHDQLAQISQIFRRKAESVRNSTHDLRNRESALRAGDWAGDSAEKFYAEMEIVVFPALRRLADALSLAAETTHNISEVIKRADEEAAKLWKAQNSSPGAVPDGKPTQASISGVVDERPPLVQWLGDNTPLAFIPGFTPPAGGDIETIQLRLRRKFGRDVNVVDGNEKWTNYEVAAVDRAVNNLPDSLTQLSLIRNFYRDRSDGGGTLAFWLPPSQTANGDAQHEPESITFMAAVPLYVTRQGAPDDGSRVETVVFHELVHSAQFRPDGSLSDLTRAYLENFDWSFQDGQWKYSGPPNAFPGSSDSFLTLPVAYPTAQRTGLDDMAEAVTYYRYEPATLRRDSPERYEWVKQNIFDGREF